KTVTWSSDKNNIATVDANGKVTAVAVGTAKITVTTTDGSKTAVCDVTVTPIPVTGVSLDKTTASLFVGNTVTLTPTVSPAEADNKNVTWSTSNSTVATVNNGVVTGAAAGVATITVTTVDQSKTATCLVTVAAAPIAITGVAVSPATLGLTVDGQTSTLSVVYTPANANTQKSVAWSTSNSAVAGVNATTGVVSPVAAGVATITVTVVDTSDVSRTATCLVTVSPAPVRVTGVTVNPTTLSLSAGGATGSITPTVLPGDASNKNVTWSSSADSIATVANGVVTPVSAGVATITVTTVDGAKTATCLVTVGAAPQSQTTVTFNNPVEGLSTGDMKIYITAGTNTSFNASTFIATTTVVVVDPDSDTGEGNRRFVKVSESTDTRVVLMNNGLPFSIKSFQSLTFTTAIPAGAKVEIIKWLGSSGEVVSTSNNL
ncbi:MAG: Ig-like domain-containing protein, partial [Candidatus Riflebacteria bacterium]|nr:Ig-like domain-containing protein [Candidatus Riflebacteria bacterium]